MRKNQVTSLLPILKAWEQGKIIQTKQGDEWVDYMGDTLAFSRDSSNYRIKPEPKVTWYITFGRSDLSAYTWIAVTEVGLKNYLRQLTADADRKLLYIVKETDGVREFIENPLA